MLEIKDEKTFELEVEKSNIPVLVDFYATWCGPCKSMAPIIEELADEFEGSVKIVKCDIEDVPEITTKYRITNVPTFLFFKDGEIVNKKVGAVPRKELETILQTLNQ